MDFALMLNTWKAVLLQPGEEAFANERAKPHATLNTAVIWVLIAAVVAAVFGFLRGLLAVNTMAGMDEIFRQADLPPEVVAQLGGLLSGGLVGAGSLMSIVLVPVFFLISVGIYYVIARLLGGTGDYGSYAYLIATFQAPITILTAVLGLIPFLGGCVGFLLSIYGLVLTYFATKVAHGLTSGKAIAVVLIPVVVVLLLVGCLFIGAMGLILSMAN